MNLSLCGVTRCSVNGVHLCGFKCWAHLFMAVYVQFFSFRYNCGFGLSVSGEKRYDIKTKCYVNLLLLG